MWEKVKDKIRKYMFINYLRILKVALTGLHSNFWEDVESLVNL